MLVSAAAIVIAYLVGSVPVAYLAGRATKGVDIRERGSGNVGASNVWQSVSRWLVVPVGVAQIAQGLGAVLIARALDQGGDVQAACGIAAVAASDWNPWLRFTGGRGIGVTIGVLLALSPWALAIFIVMAVAGVLLRAIPQGVALALISTPITAAIAGEPASTIVAFAALTALALAKRLLGNQMPDPAEPRPEVWLNRLVLDRDVRDRETWIRRNPDRTALTPDP